MNVGWRDFQLAFTLVVLSLALFLVDLAGFSKPLRYTFDLVTVPVERLIYQGSQKIGREIAIFWELRSILGKYRTLEREHSRLLADFSHLSQVAQENEILRQQFARSQTQSSRLLPAKVIGLTRYLLINRGESDGVKVGQVVVLEDSLIGRVIGVTPGTAKILLPTDPESKITAKVGTGDYHPKGVVVGDFGVGMHLEKILPEEKIEVGDLVLTLGEGADFGAFYPKNLVIGKISGVKKSDNDLFQLADLEPIFPYRDLNLVFVRLE